MQLSWRDVQARYRGSWLGLVWSLLNPLLMLALYTFVFAVVFQARWNDQTPQSDVDFALALFSGLIAFNLFAETVTAAPGLILANPSYVKKVIFPLEILPLTKFLSSLVQAGFSLLVLEGAVLLARGYLPWTLVLLPLVVLPIALLALGVSWFLASLGVFIRDIGNLVSVGLSMLMFLSPVFYPMNRLPASMQGVLAWNPLAPMVDNFRRVTLEGAVPNWTAGGLATAFALLVAVVGYTWFARSKNAFADVV